MSLLFMSFLAAGTCLSRGSPSSGGSLSSQAWQQVCLVDVSLIPGIWTIDSGITLAALAEESLTQASVQALSHPFLR